MLGGWCWCYIVLVCESKCLKREIYGKSSEMNRTEKIQIKKSSGVYTYTGTVEVYDEDSVLVRTTRGETLIFRKEQIEAREVLEENA